MPVDLLQPVGEAGRPGLQDVAALDLVQATALHRGRGVPAGACGHALGTKFLAAPGTQDHVGRAACGLSGVLDDAVAAHALTAEFREHVFAACDADEFRDPRDRADHRLVPLLEVHARPARPHRRCRAYPGVPCEAAGDPRLGPVRGAHHPGNQTQRVEDLGDAPLVGDQHIQAGADQFVGKCRLHVREADHQIRLQRHDAVDLAVEEGAHPRLGASRLRRAHGVAADAHDAVLLAEQVQPLGGFFGKADDALGAHRRSFSPAERQVQR